MLKIKEIELTWNAKNKNWYVEKVYVFTKFKDSFKVKIEDLQDNCSTKIEEVYCDNCGKKLNSMTWQRYNTYVHEDGTYYCSKCGKILFGNKKQKETVLKNSISFGYWLIKNLSLKQAIAIIARWDNELNKCDIRDVCYSSDGIDKKGYYFKCPRNIHPSELHSIKNFVNDHYGSMDCKMCNSFAQWCIDYNRQDIIFLWDYELNNCNPFDISRATNNKYYFKCPRGLHPSELKSINQITSENKISLNCNMCNSFAQWGIDNICPNFLEKYWDYEKNVDKDGNSINPWLINYGSNTKVYLFCQETDYHGSYDTRCSSFVLGSRCFYCNRNSGKVHPLDSIGYYIINK